MTTEEVRSDLYHIDEQGYLGEVQQCESPNQDARPAECDLELVVVHGISLPPGEFGGPHVERLFCNALDWNEHPYFQSIRGLRVSAHVLIRRDGSLVQFVPFSRRAWHAGESEFRGRETCNDYSIGIEMEGEDTVAYEDAQYTALGRLCCSLFGAYPRLCARRIAAHSDIAPGRKTDPGPAFDWLRLYDALALNTDLPKKR